MQRIVLTFGFIAGGILAVMMLITMLFQDQLGFDRGAIVGYTTMVLAFLLIFFGVRSYRDTVAGGTVKFGRAFLVGLLIMLVASSCYVATWEVIYYGFKPDFGEKYAAYEIQKARASGATEAQVAARQQEMEQFKQMYRNPLVNVALTFLEPLPVGIVFTLVAAVALSRRQRQSASAARG